MNFLAHIFLSGSFDDVMLGNFMADFIKGSKFRHLESGIVKGIMMHRSIDAYTDSHPEVEKSKEKLRGRWGKHAPVIVDIFYDHFLAVNWASYSEVSLQNYLDKVYAFFNVSLNKMPEVLQERLPVMIEYNWLYQYKTFHGVERALKGLSARSRFRHDLTDALEDMETHYSKLNDEFLVFFDDLRVFTEKMK